MSIQISDCTIRDGGYLVEKDFAPDFVKDVINGLVHAGIDYIETGFLQKKVMGESIVYSNSKDVRQYIPSFRGDTEFVGFCDNSRYSIEYLDDCDGESFESLRISFAKHEWKEALEFCAAATEKGYHVFVQPMDAPGYTCEERKKLIDAVNMIKPYCFSIVDTFGAMYLDDLCLIFEQVNRELDKTIKVGLHTHNNLQLSNALAEEFIDLAVMANRSIIVDGSLYGMGRGAGNASLEVVASYINTKYKGKYDLGEIFDTIEKYIIPIRTTITWGYNLPMFICGEESSHVDNIYYLQKNKGCNAKQMYQILKNMDIDKRKRYGDNYSKTDFSELERACKEYEGRIKND